MIYCLFHLSIPCFTYVRRKQKAIIHYTVRDEAQSDEWIYLSYARLADLHTLRVTYLLMARTAQVIGMHAYICIIEDYNYVPLSRRGWVPIIPRTRSHSYTCRQKLQHSDATSRRRMSLRRRGRGLNCDGRGRRAYTYNK